MSTAEPTPAGATTAQAEHEHAGKGLGYFLCWAVVFADIGTSVYYVPGILYGQVGDVAGLFVTLTLAAFVLLTLKYAEVSVRFPEGGGVVTVAARGLNPWAGAVGGMFILVDYFLTAAISSLSGLQYFAVILPGIRGKELPLTLIALALLGLLNWYGVRESATVSAYIAVAAFVSDMVILLLLAVRVPPAVIGQVFTQMFSSERLTGVTILTGFAGAFLAFSGLESISQLSPVMQLPRSKTVTRALALVVVTVAVTSPLLTIFSTVLLTTPRLLAASHLVPPGQATSFATNAVTNSDQFISLLARAGGGGVLAVAVAVTASTLLIFASNTAIIGTYHVLLALSRMRFFPSIVERTNRLRGTPHISIILATGIPMLVLLAVRGDITTLGDMYAFGLLGAFSLTCVSLDVLRWRERRGGARLHAIADGDRHLEVIKPRAGVPEFTRREREARREAGHDAGRDVAHPLADGARHESARRQASFARRIWPDVNFVLGVFTTLVVLVAWAVNLKTKTLATEFGGGVTLLGVAIAVVHYRWQQRRGVPLVFPMGVLQARPGSSLVVLTPETQHNAQVLQVALENADDNPVVVLYLTPTPPPRPQSAFQFNDPYLFDTRAQRIFSKVANMSRRRGVATSFVYLVGDLGVAQRVWRVLQADAIICEAGIEKEVAKQTPPEYLRFQLVDGVKVAILVRHHVSTLDTSVDVYRRRLDGSGTPTDSRGSGRMNGGSNGSNGFTDSNGANGSTGATGSNGANHSTDEAGARLAPLRPAQDPTIEHYVWDGERLIVKNDDPTTSPN